MEKEKKPARWKWKNKYARFYAVVGLTSLVIAGAIIGISAAIRREEDTTVDQPQIEDSLPTDTPEVLDPPVEVLSMMMPVAEVTIATEHGFFHNQTLGYYGHHDGVDFEAEAGQSVVSVLDGTVESIYKADLLCGTEIVVDHGDGLKTVYRYVDEVDGLQVGDKVSRGQQIASVAEASGGEYKQGAHLHFEVLEKGVSVNPEVHLPLADK